MNNSNLVTTCNFRGKDFLISLYLDKNNSGSVELKVTEKTTLEEWLGSYDVTYIENLTRKTGNYKQFDTFVSMLKSGLLGTSQCVSLDLLTFEDLELLRNRISQNHRGVSQPSNIMTSQTSNRRYLIVTYTVEFDRIHYPLALEYSGLPDPRVLQKTIKRLEKQVTDLEQKLHDRNWNDISGEIDVLQNKVVDITAENLFLKEQIQTLNNMNNHKQPFKDISILKQSIQNLENKLKIKDEKIENLKRLNYNLSVKLEKAQNTGFKRTQLKANHIEPELKSNAYRLGLPGKLPSPTPRRNKSLENRAEKPFSRCFVGERKVLSARSSFDDMGSISSEDSPMYFGKKRERSRRHQFKLSPKLRSVSPSLSELSHNSEISRCACKTCLSSKYHDTSGEPTSLMKKKVKGIGKTTLMKRIRSLEKLVNGIILN